MGWRDWFSEPKQQSITFSPSDYDTQTPYPYDRASNVEFQRANEAYDAVLPSGDQPPPTQVRQLRAALRVWMPLTEVSMPTTLQYWDELTPHWLEIANAQLFVGERILGAYHHRGKEQIHFLVTDMGLLVKVGATVTRERAQSVQVRANPMAVIVAGLIELGGDSFFLDNAPLSIVAGVAIERQQASRRAGHTVPPVKWPEQPKVNPAPTLKRKAGSSSAQRKRNRLASADQSTPRGGAAEAAEPSSSPEPPRSRPELRLIRSARDAEMVAAAWMIYMGFDGAKATGLGPDGGIDVEADGVAAQVKLHGKPIGRPPLQQLRGATNPGETLLFFSLTGYTPQGVQWANEVGMALFQFDFQGEPEPVNEAASKLLSAS